MPAKAEQESERLTDAEIRAAQLEQLEARLEIGDILARITKLAHNACIFEDDGTGTFVIFTLRGEYQEGTVNTGFDYFILPNSDDGAPQRLMQKYEAYLLNTAEMEAYDNGDTFWYQTITHTDGTPEDMPLFYTHGDYCIDLYGIQVAFGEQGIDLANRIKTSFTSKPVPPDKNWIRKTTTATHRAVPNGNHHSPSQQYKKVVPRGPGRHSGNFPGGTTPAVSGKNK